MLLIYSHRKSEISNIDVDRHDDWINHIRNRSFKPLDLIKLMASSKHRIDAASDRKCLILCLDLILCILCNGRRNQSIFCTDDEGKTFRHRALNGWKKNGYFNKIIHWQSGSKHIFLSVFLLVRSPSWHAAWACQCASWKNTTSRYDDHPQSCRIWKAIEIDFQP